MFRRLAASLWVAAWAGLAAAGAALPALTGDMTKAALAVPPRILPALPAQDAAGQPAPLAAFRGRLLVLNLWATWCAPCRKELPGLDRLAERMKDKGVAVAALSIDRAGPAKASPFLDALGIRHLVRLYDPSMRSLGLAGVRGLPTTLILDSRGREVARLAGDAAWDGPAAAALIEALAGR